MSITTRGGTWIARMRRPEQRLRHLADFRRPAAGGRTAPARSAPTAAPAGAAASNAPPAASWIQNVSSAMPLVSVWMRASTIEAPATASAPAIWLNRPAWSAAVDRHLGHRARRQRLRIHGQRRACAPRRRASGGRGGRASPDRTTASSRDSRVDGNARYPPATSPSSSAAAACLARATRTSRSVVDKPAGQHLGDARVKLAQQRRLPAVPDLRRHRAHVGDGQHQQQPQPLRRLDGVGEVENGLGVVDVALERGLAQQQMMQHQPGDRFGLLGASGPARARPPARSRRRARNDRRRGPWRCRAAASPR